MAENRQCHINIKNMTNGPLSLSGTSLDWGKWHDSPPAQIHNTAVGTCFAQGRKDTATGTEGTVTYTLPDNSTTLSIHFDAPYSAANSGSMQLSGCGASNY